jgi:hypothetical protein
LNDYGNVAWSGGHSVDSDVGETDEALAPSFDMWQSWNKGDGNNVEPVSAPVNDEGRANAHLPIPEEVLTAVPVQWRTEDSPEEIAKEVE